MQPIILKKITTCALVLALGVVMLGAYTRLTDAGLGCPDWPGCYGHLILPENPIALAKAQQQFPHSPIEASKAWTEMAHRYIAGILVMLVVFLSGSAFGVAAFRTQKRRYIAGLLLCLVTFQAILGMWTVSMQLLPVVVMSHLLGGMLILASLSYLRATFTQPTGYYSRHLRIATSVGVLLVFCQIALGGWVSANYAGIACIGFPQCNGHWIPTFDWLRAFNVFATPGNNYQGGLLSHDARVTIQFVHRIGALVVALYVLTVSGVIAYYAKKRPQRAFAQLAALLVTTQCGLGILNVIWFLPLGVAVLHNGVAALLLATMVCLRYTMSTSR